MEFEKTEAHQRRTDALAAIEDPIERFLTVMAGFDTHIHMSRIEQLPSGWVQAAFEHCSDVLASNGTVRLSERALGEWFATHAAAQGLPTTTIDVVRRGWMRGKAKAHQAWVLAGVYERSVNRSDETHAGDVYLLTDGRLFMQDRPNPFSGRPVAGTPLTTGALWPVAYSIMGRLLRLGS